MSKDGQGTKCRRKIAENYSRLSRVHERYRDKRTTDDIRQTDGRATAYSEREHEFMFAKKPPVTSYFSSRTFSICMYVNL